MLLSRALSFLMLPLYTHYLTPADYGVIQLIEMTFDVVSIVAGSRLAVGIFRFYFKAETASARRSVVSTALILLTTGYTFVAVLAFLASVPISQLMFNTASYAGIIQIAAASFAFQGMLEVPLAYLRLTEKPTAFVAITVGKLFVQASLNFFFLAHLRLGVEGIFLSSLIAHFVAGVALAIQLLRATGVNFSRSSASDLFRFGLPLVVTQIATFVSTYADRYFLQAAGGTAVVGLYALAYNMGFLLFQIGHTPFAMVWDPKRYAIAKQPNRDDLYARGFIFLNVLLLSVAVVIALYTLDLLRVVAQPAYYPAAEIVPIILIAYVLQSWTAMQDIGIMIRERTSFTTLANWTAALVALAGYVWLIPRYLGLGAALATVAAFLVRFLMIYTISQRLWRVRYQWGPVARLVALATAAVTVSVLLPPMDVPASVGIRLVLLILYFVGLWHSNVIPAPDRSALRDSRSLRALLSQVAGLVRGASGIEKI